jgi:hypothetical protein
MEGLRYSRIGKFFNTFGSNVTHIANAYGSPILIIFTDSSCSIRKFSFSYLRELSIEFNDPTTISSEFTIQDQESCRYGRKSEDEYMTVFDVKNEKKNAGNYRIAANISVIIMPRGSIMKIYLKILTVIHGIDSFHLFL